MTITGPGASNLAVRRDQVCGGCVDFRLFAVLPSAGQTVTIEDVTVSGARATGFSGGALGKGGIGMLILDSVVFTDNRAGTAGAISFANGFTSIRNSTFNLNQATDGSGGAIVGRSSSPTVHGEGEVIDSTITGNSATLNAGGITVFEQGRIVVNSSTIAGNTADSDNNSSGSGGGLNNQSTGTAPVFSIANTLLAGNAVGTTVPVANQCNGTFVSSGYNLRQTADIGCTGFTEPPDIVNPSPMLDPPGDNGGPTPTIALMTGSPAINAGNPATPGSGAFPICPADDQRGLLRGGSAGVCDIGAFEIAPHPTSTAVVCAPTSITLGAGSSTCTATVTDPFAPVTPTGIVSFGSSGTGTFSGGSCALAVLSASQANCSLTYTPTELGSGSHQITGSYGGDTGHNGSQGLTTVAVLTPPIAGTTTTATPFDLGAAIKRCKKKFPKGPKRKKCIKRAKRRAQA